MEHLKEKQLTQSLSEFTRGHQQWLTLGYLTQVDLMKSFLLFTILLTQTAFAQLKISGRTVDNETQLPLPFVHIFSDGVGTISNEDGEFQLTVREYGIPVLFSHVGYERISIFFDKEIDTLVRLNVMPILLEGVIVDGNNVKSIVQNAYNKIIESSLGARVNYFYRQTTKNDNVYSELLEIFYKADVSPAGISKWRVNQGRYAVRTDFEAEDYIVNRNFSILIKRMPLALQEPRSYIVPLIHNAEDYYEFELKEIRKAQDTILYYISFVPKPACPHPGFKGTLIIDDNYNLHRFSGVLKDSRFKPVDERIREKVSNLIFQVDIYCNLEVTGHTLPSTIHNQLSYDYKTNKRKLRKIKSQSVFTIISYENDTINFEDSAPEDDFEAIRESQSRYDESFWESNEIIKRTPIEKELLRQFKSNKAFNRIFQKK